MVTWGTTITVIVVGGLIGAGLYLALRSVWYLWRSNSFGFRGSAEADTQTLRQHATTLAHAVVVLAGLVVAYFAVAWAFVSIYH